jgi:Cu-Zn family superoxide dismutase
MDSNMHWRRAALIGLAAIAVGCAPDTGERNGAPQGRTGDAAPPGAQPDRQPSVADRDTRERPPTNAANPAGPGAAAAPPAAPRLLARADIRPVGDSTVRGTVEFRSTSPDGSGPLMIDVALMGLAAGPHGFHVHEGGDCAAPGEHLNPQNSPHGPANAAAGARHLGDLGNITADASGIVDETLHDSLLGSEVSMIVGKAIVVHEGQDDLSTQPSGDSGDPVACGIVEEAGEDVLSRGEAPTRGI